MSEKGDLEKVKQIFKCVKKEKIKVGEKSLSMVKWRIFLIKDDFTVSVKTAGFEK